MAVFGIPFELKNHSELAVHAALEMLKKLGEMNCFFGGGRKGESPNWHTFREVDFWRFWFTQKT